MPSISTPQAPKISAPTAWVGPSKYKIAGAKINAGFKKFGQGAKKVINNEGFQIGASALGSIGEVLPSKDKEINSADATMGQMRSSIHSSLLKSGNPWAMAAGALSMGIEKLGGNSDASKGLGGGTDAANAVASMIPGIGWIAGKTNKFAVDEKLADSAGYTGTAGDAETAASNAGAKLLFGRKKANRLIEDARAKQNKVTNILDFNTAITDSSGVNAQDIADSNKFKDSGGWNQGAVMYGKKGLKVELEKAKRLRESREVKKFANGGKLDQNVIPSGALHVHKHNIDSEELEGQITKKGVPVISGSREGEITQHAEVERGEIIFRKEVTEKLEILRDKGTEEAMIEAGKLITEEILRNTLDKSQEYGIENQGQNI